VPVRVRELVPVRVPVWAPGRVPVRALVPERARGLAWARSQRQSAS